MHRGGDAQHEVSLSHVQSVHCLRPMGGVILGAFLGAYLQGRFAPEG